MLLSRFARPLLASAGWQQLPQSMRSMTSTSGAQHAEPAVAAAEVAGPTIVVQQGEQAVPRWIRELGVIRNDWT